ncbi:MULTISPECIES: hypothetical protein [Pseudomonas]|uniref:hypothetical protein n=1 Tax=Pseudomonas TaxID=286 RepID=UPI00235F713A|nr:MULTISPECIES: hypothetical protein [Pseudomonas]WJV26269.1 hypothetical protein PSR66_09615 [Pseudomonas chlororaphis]
MPPTPEPLAAQARTLARQGDWAGARAKLMQLVDEVIGVTATDLIINRDQYSLNSLNGRVTLSDARQLFFKYHNEEGEDKTIEEYYNAELLRDTGYRVDVPLFACGEPGRQILFYTLRDNLRLADVCRDIEERQAWNEMSQVVEAQRQYDHDGLAGVLRTLGPGEADAVCREPIHQLFHHRLVSANNVPGFGGRVERAYVGKTFVFPGTVVEWDQLKDLRWTINGVTYASSLGELFAESGQRLAPQRLADHGVVTAHGDAHNANVWYEKVSGQAPRLVSFDPAFAGRQIPALLAEIKATFHNIFAHPVWLYEPTRVASQFHVTASIKGEQLIVEHNWQLTPLRSAFLESKSRHYWQPLLAALRDRHWLPTDWERVMRLALFCCPTLVLDLRADGGSGHTAHSSALGLALAMIAGSEPVEGEDIFSRFFSGLQPH